MVGVLIPHIPISEKTCPLSGLVVEARSNYIILQSGPLRYYVSSKENDFELGDYLYVEGSIKDIQFSTYESRFDFKDYLSNKGVDKEIEASNIDRKFRSFIRTQKIKKNFLSHFDENAASLIAAFLFNEKDYSSTAINRSNDLGVIYLFSLSGIYLHLLFSILTYVFSLKFSKKTSQILPFLVLLPFAFFSFTKIGTLRVYAMYLLKYLNEFHFKRKRSHIELVSILALIFVIIDYHLVYQEAFYIGFLLSMFTPILHNAVGFIQKKKRKFVLIPLLRLSLFPIQVSDGYFKLFSSLIYIILFPINTLFILLTIASFFIPFYSLINNYAKGITWILEKMELINIKIPFGNWGGYFGIIFYAVFVFAIYLMESVRLKHLKNLSIISIIIVLFSIIPLQEPLTNSVHFINVGQGDSILIKNRTHTIMIDTGGQRSFDIAKETLIPFMHKNKITHLDALITTHDDFDHNGAKESLLSNFKVNQFLNKADQFPYKVGDIEIKNLNVFEGKDDNDNSLVLSLNFMKKKWLFMGDASTIVEEELVSAYNDLDCDILKIGHHGSKTSTCENFIKAVSPKEAIISVGAKNYYGHPNDEVLEILSRNNVKIRRTDQEGTISYFSLVP